MATKKVAVLDEFSWQLPVKDKDLSSPPGSPTKGDRYIIAATGSGLWTGQTGNIALCTVGGGSPSWEFVTKAEGMICWVEDENLFYFYNGSSWVAGPQGDQSYHKIGVISYNLATGSGTVVVTGLGFTSKVVSFFGFKANTTIGTFNGVDDGTNHYCIAGAGVNIGIHSTRSIWFNDNAGNQITGYISTIGSDGFTITFRVESGSFTGIVNIFYKAEK